MSDKIKKEAWKEIADLKEKAGKHLAKREGEKSKRLLKEAQEIRAKHNC